ncbi:MAG: MFS transporter [Nitrolancea sp.]
MSDTATIEETTTEADPTGPNPWLVLISVALGLLMVIVDISILNIALPSIATSMNASLAEIEWTLIAYTLALTGLVPFFGRISDVFGRKRLFIVGELIFAGASLLAAQSPFMLWLIGARVLQALGGALISSNTLAIITDTFPAGKRGAAMGVQAILISGGAAIGPTLGGFLVTHFGWQSVFYVNVPLGLIAAAFGAKILPPLRTNRSLEPIDWTGSILLFVGLSGTLLGVTKGPDWGWTTGRTLVSLIGGLFVLALFVLWEMRRRAPLVDLTLFKIQEFTAGQLAGLFATMSLSSLTFLFPFYWQGMRGYSAEKAGILFLPLPLALMIAAPISGRLSDRVGARGISTAGLLVLALALFLLSRITVDMSIWNVMWRLSFLGAGLGMFTAPNNNAVMSSVPSQRRGIAAGLLGMFRFTGQSAGIAFAGVIFAIFAVAPGGFALHGLPTTSEASGIAANPAQLEQLRTAFVHGLDAVALAAIPFACVGALLSLLRGRTTD